MQSVSHINGISFGAHGQTRGRLESLEGPASDLGGPPADNVMLAPRGIQRLFSWRDPERGVRKRKKEK